MKTLLLRAVVQNYIKTSRHRNNELVQTPVCVPTTLRATGNVIKIINALDLKGYMAPRFDECEISSWISDFRKINDSAFRQES